MYSLPFAYFLFNNNNHENNNNFNFRLGQNEPMYQNRNAYFRTNQQNFDYSDQHWCETCDRGFNTQDQLERHKQQHQKCNIDGCQFVAHPKVITKHIQMQHSSGLYKRIAKLDNPEEIKKWIEERKKKYPTKENIEKKSAEIKEKIQRGEKMGLRQDRFQRNNFQGQGLKRKNISNTGNNQQPKHLRKNKFDKPQIKKPKRVNIVAPIDETRKLRPFTGIQNIDMDSDSGEEPEQTDCNFVIEDDEFETNIKVEEKKPTVCSALSSLMCTYGSSDEENEDATEVSIKTEVIEQNKVEIKAINFKVDGTEIKNEEQSKKHERQSQSDEDSGPEEVKVVKPTDIPSAEVVTSSETTTNTAGNKTRKKDNQREYRKHSFIRPKPKVPSTLLNKLLHREVEHERNVILQCVRHIVKNNYFDN